MNHDVIEPALDRAMLRLTSFSAAPATFADALIAFDQVIQAREEQDDINQEALRLLDDTARRQTTVRRTYRGKPGCRCGCRGRYSDNPVGFRILAMVQDMRDSWRDGHDFEVSHGPAEEDDDTPIVGIHIEDGTRDLSIWMVEEDR